MPSEDQRSACFPTAASSREREGARRRRGTSCSGGSAPGPTPGGGLVKTPHPPRPRFRVLKAERRPPPCSPGRAKTKSPRRDGAGSPDPGARAGSHLSHGKPGGRPLRKPLAVWTFPTPEEAGQPPPPPPKPPRRDARGPQPSRPSSTRTAGPGLAHPCPLAPRASRAAAAPRPQQGSLPLCTRTPR